MFHRVVVFRELFSVFTFFSVLSVLAFLTTFFIQSWTMIVIIRRTSENFPGYEKIKKRYMLVQFLCTVISAAAMLLLSYFTGLYKSSNAVMFGFIEFVATGLISMTIFFFLNRKIIKSQTEKSMEKKQRCIEVIKFSVGIPFAIGITSWLFVFPLQLIIRKIIFNEARSEPWQVVTLSLVILIMIVISMIPGFFISL